jgi:hypothetical protein
MCLEDPKVKKFEKANVVVKDAVSLRRMGLGGANIQGSMRVDISLNPGANSFTTPARSKDEVNNKERYRYE